MESSESEDIEDCLDSEESGHKDYREGDSVDNEDVW